jgi:sorbitol-6-phosphate 2-dehydrogenase
MKNETSSTRRPVDGTDSARELTVGPILRGLSAPVDRTGIAGPGALYELFDADSARSSGGSPAPSGGSPTPSGGSPAPSGGSTAPSGGSAGEDGPVLTLKAQLDLDSIAAAWNDHVAKHQTTPRLVVLPSGAQWVMKQPALYTSDPASDPGRDATSNATSDLTGDADEELSPRDLAGAVRGRVTLVTGAAQGFGWQIARGLAALGACVALADINAEGVEKRARELGTPHASFPVDVTSEDSVATLFEKVTRRFGGVDLVVSNAGVLKAGSVMDLALEDFHFVTNVNYVGFFLMSKHAAPVMKLQNEAARSPDAARTDRAACSPGAARTSPKVTYLTDIVEINSKSGLEGSNKNAAYAGSKFGGIGLVQSFALELVEQGTKVNAICPGNFLDGPLWSDPERGLFVQYLRAGKVPGATTIAEVRRFYEEKVPMKRGCTGADVVRAIAYVVSQRYETGQALPVTGGQVMLS